MSRTIDLAYVVDTTGSMKAYLDQCKNTIHDVLREVGALYPDHTMRFACVSYKDWSDKAKRIEFCDFVNDPQRIKDFLDTVTAAGGGDECEDVLGGLEKVTQLNWQSSVRVIYHICDAPPHNTMYHDGCGDFWKNGYDGVKHGGRADPANYHCIVLDAMRDLNIQLFAIAKMNTTVDKMIRVFQEHGNTFDPPLKIEQCDLKDANELLSSVVIIIKTAVDAIEYVEAPIIDPEMMAELGIEDPFRNPNKYKAYVGLDFGTEGTGFAYSFGDGEIYWQQTWTSNAAEKELTNILLKKSTKAGKPSYRCVGFGKDAVDKYLKERKYANYHFFRRFKMALYDLELRAKREAEEKDPGAADDEKSDDSDLDSDDDIDDGNKEDVCLVAANGEQVPAKIVFAQALRFMRKVVMKTLSTSDIMNVCDVQWIISVPAIWSNYAKQIMRDAAFDAGMTQKHLHDHMRIATEPECASVLARRDLRDVLRDGDKYILLDLGGGTADIACHALIGENTIEQILPPQGGKWGSSYIDEAYLQFLKNLFTAEHMNAYEQYLKDRKKGQDWIEIISKFRHSKHGYDGTADRSVELPVSLIRFLRRRMRSDEDATGEETFEDVVSSFEFHGTPDLVELSDNMLEMKQEIWNDLFGTVLTPIIGKTEELLALPKMADTKHILLVGGLSSSQYVQKQICDAFNERYAVHTVPRPILAVVSGACEYGVNPSKLTDTCIVQYTVGIQVRRPWKGGETTDPRFRSFDETRKQFMIDGAFHKLYTINEKITANEAPPPQFFKPSIGDRKEQCEVSIQLFCSNDPDPVLVTDAGCRPLCDPTIVELREDWAPEDLIPIQFRYTGTEFKVYIAAKKWMDNYRDIRIKWTDMER